MIKGNETVPSVRIERVRKSRGRVRPKVRVRAGSRRQAAGLLAMTGIAITSL